MLVVAISTLKSHKATDGSFDKQGDLLRIDEKVIRNLR